MSIYVIAMKVDNHIHLESPSSAPVFLGCHGEALRDIPKRQLCRRLCILRSCNELIA